MRWLLLIAGLLLGAAAIATAIVESEAAYRLEDLGGAGPARALVLFHPSRDAHFSDDLSSALADGIRAAGLQVHRATLTHETPAAPKGYALVAVVSNTYWWTPDLPTQRYLARAQLQDMPVIGLMGGAGATARSQRLLEEALRSAGGQAAPVRSFWLWRPNDEKRSAESNRQVALDLARQFGRQAASAAIGTTSRPGS